MSDMIEDRQAVYTRPSAPAATATTSSPTVQTYRLNNEIDEESNPTQYHPATHVTIASTNISPVVKHNVRPAPQPEAAVYTKPATATTTTTTVTQNVVQTVETLPSKFYFAEYASLAYFAFLVLVAAAYSETHPGANNNGLFIQYELTTAQIGFAVALAAMAIERMGTKAHHPIRVALAAFLLFLWAPALVIATFFGSFMSPLTSSNGFFGCWGALIVSAIVFMHELRREPSSVDDSTAVNTTSTNAMYNNGGYTSNPNRVRNNRNPSSAPIASAALLLFTSLMVMGAGIQLHGNENDDEPSGYVAWAIAFGAAAAFFSLVFMLIAHFASSVLVEFFGTLLCLFVTGGALVLTFGDPFKQALGNGYYACLFSIVASFGLFMASRRRHDNTQAQAQTQTQTQVRESFATRRFFFALRALAFASAIVMIAGILLCTDSDNCDYARRRYEIAAGAVSLGLTLPVVLLEYCGLYRVNSWFKIFYALLLVLWWIAAFIVLTFLGSFQSPTDVNMGAYANGYFFTWLGLITAGLAFSEALKERAITSQNPTNPFTPKIGYLVLVGLGSAIELGAAIQWYHNTESVGLARYALAVGSASILLCLILFFVLPCLHRDHNQHDRTYTSVLVFLVLWWLVATLVLTFRQDFWSSAIGNGYFGTNFTLIASLFALNAAWRDRSERTVVRAAV